MPDLNGTSHSSELLNAHASLSLPNTFQFVVDFFMFYVLGLFRET